MANFKFDLKNNKQQAMLAIALAILVMIALDVYVILRPQISRIMVVLSQRGRVALDLRMARSDVSNIGRYKSDIEAYKEKVDLYEKRLPAEAEIPGLLEDLSVMAKRSGITIVGITPVPKAPVKEEKAEKERIYQEFPILISAKSGYHELGSFLNDMENAARFMKVVDIEIRTNKSTPKKHDVDLIVCTYILLNEK